MLDNDMDEAVMKAINMNSTDEWLARAKEIQEHFNPATRSKRLTESLKRNDSGEISPSNFFWGEDSGQTEQADELDIQPKNGGGEGRGGTTSDVEGPEMDPVGDGKTDAENDMEIDYDPERGIRIEICGKSGYIPNDQIPELVAFAKSVMGDGDSGNEDGNEEEDEGEDGDDTPDGGLPDFSSFMR